jgi:hypothetical protein
MVTRMIFYPEHLPSELRGITIDKRLLSISGYDRELFEPIEAA